MSFEVKVPPMGESISSGVLAKWHVKEGDTVKEGQALFDLETDKITSEATAGAAGVVHLLAGTGDEVKIGQVVARIEAASAAPAPTPASPTAAPVAAAPAGEVVQSPAVRRLATETGIDPATVPGTGKGGRVTKPDMLAAVEAKAAPAAAVSAPAPKPVVVEAAKAPAPAPKPAAPVAAPGERTVRTKLTPLRRKIAERLVEAQNQAALLTTFNEVDMSAVMALRAKHQEAFTKAHGVKLGFMSFFVKATVHALQAVPALNAQIDGDTLIQNKFFDIGVAVSTERGLMVPVVRDCEKLSFAQIEKQLGAYAVAAREGKIKIEDLQGGVFTITNGGIFGSLLSTPIVNPPQSGILGMHAIKERPIAENGQVVIRPMMYLALTYDHRIVDGKEAVTFLVKVKEAIEEPTRLLLAV